MKKIIEKVTSKTFSEFIIDNQFFTEKPNKAYFSSDSREIIENRTTSYFSFLKDKLVIDLPYNQGDYLEAANGLHLSLDAFIRWDINFKKDVYINQLSKEKMFKKYSYLEPSPPFTMGWEIINVNEFNGYCFSGSNCTFYAIFPERNISIILLANGFNRIFPIKELIKEILIQSNLF